MATGMHRMTLVCNEGDLNLLELQDPEPPHRQCERSSSTSPPQDDISLDEFECIVI